VILLFGLFKTLLVSEFAMTLCLELKYSECNLVQISSLQAVLANQHTDMFSDAQIASAAITTSLAIHNDLHQLQVKKHTVKGDDG